ncbi:uncharacterized protein LOC122333562 [Puntigrus tetrazona]|uniref:uncharacterized protein LOC122333562 n=1 Tax=Puntigrus tetrazona TaxID=1606681 RepID=UPI001C897042|nr:uncharacterized protein LOC122333562 [Puntigrus tetrazona]XP_043087180.1 uncharacterized protein LOC122333562 [Puntigrus tetrazona]
MDTLPSDPESPESSLCLSLTGSYAPLPGPQPAGHILISSPVSEIGDGQLSIITSSSTGSAQAQAESREEPRGARRSAPAPLNRSYDVENPSPSLNRPRVDSEPTRRRHSPQLHINTTAEQQIQALEVHLEREHTQQISKLLTAQERQTQHLHQEQVKALRRLTAVTRGFLTRRLLQTDKIKQLRKTIQDSRDFIRSFQTDSQLRRVSVSHQDLSLYQRVTAQLRSALHDVHQIFTVWPVRDRMSLLRQDREIRRERTLRDMDRHSPGNTRLLSSATQKTLDRKTVRQAKKSAVIPWSSPMRTLRPNSARFSQSAVEKRDECLGARQKRPRHRKYLSLG